MGNLGKLLLEVLLIAVAVGVTYTVLQETGPQFTDKAMVGFIFYDGNSDIYAHRELFASQGIKVSVAIISEQIGRECCMTWEQAKELQNDYGWTFMNHTKYHRHFSRVPVEKIRNHVYACHEEPKKHSLDLKSLVYLYNDPGNPSKRSVVAELYPFAFASGDNFIAETSDPYKLERFSLDQHTTEEIKKTVDKIASTGSKLILYGHHIVGGTIEDEGPLSVSTQKMNEIIDYIKHHSNVEIGLSSQVVQEAPILGKR